MKRIITLAAASLIAAPVAMAQTTVVVQTDESMTMMQERLTTALNDCSVELTEEEMMNLTIGDVSGIIVAANSEDSEGDKCQTIEGFLHE